MEKDLFPFKVLFCFEDQNQAIIEIKRTDIQSDDKSLVYKWLHLDKNSRQIRQLTFIGMDQADGEQFRTFAEGTLTWNAENVQFNGEEMNRIDPLLIHAEWLQLIAGFLV